MAPHTPNPQPSVPNAPTPLKCLICFSLLEGAHFPWCSFEMRAELDARLWRQVRKEAEQELRRRSKARASAARNANPLLDMPEPIDVEAEDVAMAELFDFDAASGNRHVVLATTSVLPSLQNEEDVVPKQVLAQQASKVRPNFSRSNNNETNQTLQRRRVSPQAASANVETDQIVLSFNCNAPKAFGEHPKINEEAKQISKLLTSGAKECPLLDRDNLSEKKERGKRRRLIGEEEVEAQPALKKSSLGHGMVSVVTCERHTESDEVVESPNQLEFCLKSLPTTHAEVSANTDEGSVVGQHQSNTISAEGQEENNGEEDEGDEVEEDEDDEDDEQLLERLQQDARERKVCWRGYTVGKLHQNVSETFEETFSKSLAEFESVDVGSRRMTRKAIKDAQALA